MLARIFGRIFISVSGVALATLTVLVLMLTLLRRAQLIPQLPSLVGLMLSVAFLISLVGAGVSLVVIGQSDRIWKTNDKPD